MFKELAPLLRQRSVVLTVIQEDDAIRVNFIPKKLKDGENQALTTALSVVGTPEELDAHLPSALTEYVGGHLALVSSLASAKEQMDAAAKAAKAEAKAKTTAKPASAPAKPAIATADPKKPAPPAKQEEVKKPVQPRTASLFEISSSEPTAAPATAGDSSSAGEENPNEQVESEILAEIDEDNQDEQEHAA